MYKFKRKKEKKLIYFYKKVYQIYIVEYDMSIEKLVFNLF